MSKGKIYCLIICLTLCPAAFAQERTRTSRESQPGALANLFRRNPGGNVQLDINAPTTEIPRPIEVRNGSVVTVTGAKSPVNRCVVTTRREELPPEPNPFAQIIGAIAGLGAFPFPSVRAAVAPNEVMTTEERQREINVFCQASEAAPRPTSDEPSLFLSHALG